MTTVVISWTEPSKDFAHRSIWSVLILCQFGAHRETIQINPHYTYAPTGFSNWDEEYNGSNLGNTSIALSNHQLISCPRLHYSNGLLMGGVNGMNIVNQMSQEKEY